jgi:hypothetical protein
VPVEVSLCGSPEHLARDLERHIAERTWGRVADLVVGVAGERIKVCGRAPSYYVKQLAIQACLDGLQASSPTPLRLQVDIEVVTRLPLAINRR